MLFLPYAVTGLTKAISAKVDFQHHRKLCNNAAPAWLYICCFKPAVASVVEVSQVGVRFFCRKCRTGTKDRQCKRNRIHTVRHIPQVRCGINLIFRTFRNAVTHENLTWFRGRLCPVASVFNNYHSTRKD